MGELKWYVLRVVSGQEKKVKSYLETEIERSKLVEFIPQVLIPSEKVYEMRGGKKTGERKKFLPGLCSRFGRPVKRRSLPHRE
jgi:transcriptional antiterminator NusG